MGSVSPKRALLALLNSLRSDFDRTDEAQLQLKNTIDEIYAQGSEVITEISDVIDNQGEILAKLPEYESQINSFRSKLAAVTQELQRTRRAILRENGYGDDVASDSSSQSPVDPVQSPAVCSASAQTKGNNMLINNANENFLPQSSAFEECPLAQLINNTTLASSSLTGSQTPIQQHLQPNQLRDTFGSTSSQAQIVNDLTAPENGQFLLRASPNHSAVATSNRHYYNVNSHNATSANGGLQHVVNNTNQSSKPLRKPNQRASAGANMNQQQQKRDGIQNYSQHQPLFQPQPPHFSNGIAFAGPVRNQNEITAGCGRGRPRNQRVEQVSELVSRNPVICIQRNKFDVNTPVEGKMCHFVSPTEFYIHLLSEIANSDICDKLAEADLSSKPSLTNDKIQPNVYCFASDTLSGDNPRYYRALILEKRDLPTGYLKVKVQFIDHGNSAWVQQKYVKEFHRDSENILEYQPWQAHQCVLKGVRPINGVMWSKQAANIIVECLCVEDEDGILQEGKKIAVTVEGVLRDYVYLVSVRYDLDQNGQVISRDLAKTLVNANLASYVEASAEYEWEESDLEDE